MKNLFKLHTFGEGMDGQFDLRKVPTTDLTTDFVEAHPSAHRQLLYGVFIIAHFQR